MINITVRGIQGARAGLGRNIEQAVPTGGITIGVHEGVGVHPGYHGDDDPAPPDITVASVGAINHFGKGRIPPRPWLDVGVREAQPEIDKIVKKYGETEPLEKVLDRIGKAAVESVRQYIVDLQEPGNSDYTLAIKAPKTNPLIRSGVLRESVTYEHTDELPDEGLEI